MNWLSRLLGAEKRVAREPVMLDWTGVFDVELVGESRRQDVLERLAGGKAPESCRIEVAATLHAEDNPHDKNAVAVYVNGQHVAYFSRTDNKAIRDELQALGLDEREAVSCRAIIVGGWIDLDTGDEGNFGLRLSLARPLRCL